MSEAGKHQKKTGESNVAVAVKGDANAFTKEQILTSARFRERRDIVDALLVTGERYTMAEVEERIEKYRKGKVK